MLAAHLAPRTGAYHEIWLNGKPRPTPTRARRATSSRSTARSICRASSRPAWPCRTTTASTSTPRTSACWRIVENGKIAGYNVLVGGGMGMTHGNANTFPHLAQPICYVPADAVVAAAEAVVKLFRDHGNRADRKRARIKYLVHDWGVEKFREVLAGYIGGPLDCRRAGRGHAASTCTSAGTRRATANGSTASASRTAGSRTKARLRLRTGLRTIVERFRPELRLTPMQDILLCDLDGERLPAIERILARARRHAAGAAVAACSKHSMACPAIPTCGLAISESERALPGIIDELEARAASAWAWKTRRSACA